MPIATSTKVTRGIRLTPSRKFEATVVHKALPTGRITRNWATEEEAVRWRSIVLANLDSGVVDGEVKKDSTDQIPVREMLKAYLEKSRVAASDKPTVELLASGLACKVADIDLPWAEAWVRNMKAGKFAPGTIRKRVESLARALQWWHRTHHPKEAWMNPLRSLPRGYSSYESGEVRDAKRDRRLHPGEQDKIEAAIMGWQAPSRQRPLTMADKDDFLVLFQLLINSGLRLREAYRLQVADVDLERRTIQVTRSKTGTSRSVPMNRELTAAMKKHMGRIKRTAVFPWWNGIDDPTHLARITARLSSRFRTLFDYVGAEDLVEHDLRREAISRFMTMRNAGGNYILRPEEVRKISGHLNVKIFEQYLTLRSGELVGVLDTAV